MNLFFALAPPPLPFAGSALMGALLVSYSRLLFDSVPT
jgi:hypothetical protein